MKPFNSTAALFAAVAQSDVHAIIERRELVEAAKTMPLFDRLKTAFDSVNFRFDTKNEHYVTERAIFMESTAAIYLTLHTAPKGYNLSDAIVPRGEWSKFNEATKEALGDIRNAVKAASDMSFRRFAAMMFGADSQGRFADKPKVAKDWAEYVALTVKALQGRAAKDTAASQIDKRVFDKIEKMLMV